jgi:hypothetical protein
VVDMAAAVKVEADMEEAAVVAAGADTEVVVEAIEIVIQKLHSFLNLVQIIIFTSHSLFSFIFVSITKNTDQFCKSKLFLKAIKFLTLKNIHNKYLSLFKILIRYQIEINFKSFFSFCLICI